MNYTFFDFLGNIGVGLIIISYLFLQLGKIGSTTLKFSLFNAVGALLIIISLSEKFNLSAFVIEAFWLLISFVGIIRYLNNKKKRS